MISPRAETRGELLALIGYRGTGKSTVARLVAAKLNWDWVDADEALEAKSGRRIADIFAVDGEAAFRDLESEILTGLCDRKHFVIATGGGVILREANRKRLASANIVWLTAEPQTIYDRIHSDEKSTSQRPDLTEQGGLQEIVEMLKLRKPLYESMANATFATDNLSPEVLADKIADWMLS